MYDALELGYCNRKMIKILEKLEGKTQLKKISKEGKLLLCLTSFKPWLIDGGESQLQSNWTVNKNVYTLDSIQRTV